MAEVFRHIGCETHVLLVGDVNQLSPVGHGAPLRDLLRAAVPQGLLEEIKRNSGGIVEACDAIRRGEKWKTGGNLQLHHAETPERFVEHILDIFQDFASDPKNAGISPIEAIQVITALNDKGELSRRALNAKLQGALNPPSESSPIVAGVPYRRGDKVVNGKNGEFPKLNSDTGERHYVANGELGYVEEIDSAKMTVRLEAPQRWVVVPFKKRDDQEGDYKSGSGSGSGSTDSDQGDESTGGVSTWDLGYAISCHKSQGSEWPIVVTVLDPSYGAKMVCDRAWLYTAISRAKKRQHLVGMRLTADQMAARVNVKDRRTFLKELIGLEVAKRELAEI